MKTKTRYSGLRTFLLVAALASFCLAKAQQTVIHLKTGQLRAERNISNASFRPDSLRAAHYNQKYYAVVQFDQLPDSLQKKELAENGIRLCDYVSDRAWTVELPDSFSTDVLRRFKASSLVRMTPALKIHSRLQQHPEDLQDGRRLIAVSYFGSLSSSEVEKAVSAAGATIVPFKLQPPNTLFVRLPDVTALRKLASLPFISFLASQPITPKTLNNNNRAAHGVDAVSYSSTQGRNLMGDGVTVGIGDEGDPNQHVDFTGRLIDRNPAAASRHSTHVTGTLGGAGLKNPMYKGMAPHATLISQVYGDILNDAPTYITDYNMVLTNNSWTYYDGGCGNEGEYDTYAYYTDAQLYTYPYLLHDFASGNDGQGTCSPYPVQYATVKSGFQSAKNVLTVGDVSNISTWNYLINAGSSAGPVTDGRLKPEIVAGGTGIISTIPVDDYAGMDGTSMATPAVTGSLALLVQRYRQLHSNANPYAGLVKALVCNTATDMGNPGPDFIYGFGSLNILSAIESMEANQYFLGSIPNNGSGIASITIPSGTSQLKVMLYWPDYPGTPYAAKALVNNLDLTVTDASGTIHRPLILNPDPAHVGDVAVEGVDTLNNIEQVVFNNPTAGTATLTVKGTSVPAGPQPFFLVYQIVQPGVRVLSPVGKETWNPAAAYTIRWMATDPDVNTFTAEYSLNNGSSWTTISNSVPATARHLDWTTPDTNSLQALVRITRNGTAYSDISDTNFILLGTPPYLAYNIPCKGYVLLGWGAVPGATRYDILMLKGAAFQKIADTTAISYLVDNLNKDSNYYFAVRGVIGTTPGAYTTVEAIANSGPGGCTLSNFNNDYTIDSLIAPITGRLNTSTQLSSSTPIKVRINNLGSTASATPFTVSYSINGSAAVTETPPTTIGAHSSYTYTFTSTADLSAAGSYTLQAWVSFPGDPALGNDTLTTVIRQLTNAPIPLSNTFTEGFENAAAVTYTAATTGFTGDDRVDFLTSNSNGRVRTSINTGFAHSGGRYAALDQAHYTGVTTADSLITTFNLSNYSSADQIWVDFYYRNQGNDSVRGANKVWVRGNDQAAWVPVLVLDTNPSNIGIYQASPHIDLSGALAGASPVQTVSSSTQICFGQEGYTSANSVVADGSLDDGYIFDDITLTRSQGDVGIAALVNPTTTNTCALSSTEVISIKVKNYSSAAISNITAAYILNGSTVTETIPTIAAHDSVIYTFSTTADLSAYTTYTLGAWIHAAGDSYLHNDTLTTVSIQTTPLISTFPYLEGFESGAAYWRTGGINSSWQWGMPSGTLINKAANGSSCWKTNLTGNYNSSELSYLISPCFDLTGLSQPTLSFSHIFQTEDDCACDYHYVEYSTDGVTWNKLGAAGSGTNWYDDPSTQSWQLSDTIWHVSSIPIPVKAPKVSFRFVMKSDEAVTYAGVGIDDIHVFDKAAVYSGPDITSGLTQTVSGSGWVNFDIGGKRVAAINPNGQNLGSTSVKVYFNPGGTVRNDGSQYYLDRNIVIQPAVAPIATVGIRFYFLDPEADSLIKASGCTVCSTIHDAYQSGVTQYSSPGAPTEENGSLGDDLSGTRTFHLPHQDVTVIPYDNGYYAEYNVSGFSEFWINNGGAAADQPLPVVLLSFTAVKQGEQALLQWSVSTTGDSELNRFIIEKSLDGVQWNPLDSVTATTGSPNTASYQYTDPSLHPGTNYYRIRLIDIDGNYTWSPVRTVTGSGAAGISISPNPVVNGSFTVTSSVIFRSLRLMDASGKTVLRSNSPGYQQVVSTASFARGIYVLMVDTDAGTVAQKVFVK